MTNIPEEGEPMLKAELEEALAKSQKKVKRLEKKLKKKEKEWDQRFGWWLLSDIISSAENQGLSCTEAQAKRIANRIHDGYSDITTDIVDGEVEGECITLEELEDSHATG